MRKNLCVGIIYLLSYSGTGNSYYYYLNEQTYRNIEDLKYMITVAGGSRQMQCRKTGNIFNLADGLLVFSCNYL